MSSRLQQSLVIIFAFVISVLLIFLIHGWNVGFTVDGWSLYDKINTARILGASLPAPASRPAVNIAWVIAYAIDPNSFLGANLILMTLLIAKGLLCVALLSKLTTNRPLSFAFGILALLFPADTGIFYFGALSLHVALVAWLAATWMILIFYERRRPSSALVVILMMFIGTGIYEIVFLFVPIGLLALWAKARRFNRRFLISAAIYIVVPAIMAVRYVLLWFDNSEGVAYQSSLLESSITIVDMLSSLGRAVGHHFIGGWWSNAAPLDFLLTALIIAVLVALSVVLLGRAAKSSDEQPSYNPIRMGTLFAVGLLMIVCGLALFLPTTDRNLTTRTYYFSSLGAALSLAAALWWVTLRFKVSSRRMLIFALLLGVFALIGSSRLISQRSSYHQHSLAQQQLIEQIVMLIPKPEPNVALLIIDSSPEHDLETIFGSSLIFRGILSLIYDTHTFAAAFCSEVPTPQARNVCQYSLDEVTFLVEGSFYFQSAYTRLIVMRYEGQRFELLDDLQPIIESPASRLYDPYRLFNPVAPLPPRAANMLTHSP